MPLNSTIRFLRWAARYDTLGAGPFATRSRAVREDLGLGLLESSDGKLSTTKDLERVSRCSCTWVKCYRFGEAIYRVHGLLVTDEN